MSTTGTSWTKSISVRAQRLPLMWTTQGLTYRQRAFRSRCWPLILSWRNAQNATRVGTCRTPFPCGTIDSMSTVTMEVASPSLLPIWARWKITLYQLTNFTVNWKLSCLPIAERTLSRAWLSRAISKLVISRSRLGGKQSKLKKLMKLPSKAYNILKTCAQSKKNTPYLIHTHTVRSSLTMNSTSFSWMRPCSVAVYPSLPYLS